MWNSSRLRLVLFEVVLAGFTCELVRSGEIRLLTSTELAENTRSLLIDKNAADTAMAKHAAEKIVEHALDESAVSTALKSGWAAELTQLLLPNTSSVGVKLRLLDVLSNPRPRTPYEPWKEADRAKRAGNLKMHLLEGYDRHTPPSSDDSSTEVQIGLNLFKIFGVDLQQSTLQLAAWLRLSWKDARLAFNATLWNISYLTFHVRAQDLQYSLIWTPDIELYNMEESLQHLSDKACTVYPNGGIFWSRPGVIKALCVFKGLREFPFDDVSCEMEYGSWAYSDLIMDIIPRKIDGGATWKGLEGSGLGNGQVSSLTQGTSYQDYTLRDVRVDRSVTYYTGTLGGWPVLIYTISFRRARLFYVLALVLPQLAVAILSWMTYFMHPEVGERFGYTVTLFLASCAIDITSTSFMPVCAEMLVMNWVSMVSMLLCVVAVLETALVMNVYRWEIVDLTDLLPRCADLLPRCLRPASQTRERTDSSTGIAGDSPCTGNSLRQVVPTFTSSNEDKVQVDTVVGFDDSGRGGDPPGVARDISGRIDDEDYAKEDDSEDGRKVSKQRSKMSNFSGRRGSTLKRMISQDFKEQGNNMSPDLVFASRTRKSLYARAFHLLDKDFSGQLERAEIERFGKFMFGEKLTDEKIDQIFEEYDTDGVHGLDLHEFSKCCEKLSAGTQLGDLSAGFDIIERIDFMVTTFIDIVEKEQEKNQAKWKKVSLQIDHACRIIVPFLSCLSGLIILFGRPKNNE